MLASDSPILAVASFIALVFSSVTLELVSVAFILLCVASTFWLSTSAFSFSGLKISFTSFLVLSHLSFIFWPFPFLKIPVIPEDTKSVFSFKILENFAKLTIALSKLNAAIINPTATVTLRICFTKKAKVSLKSLKVPSSPKSKTNCSQAAETLFIAASKLFW